MRWRSWDVREERDVWWVGVGKVVRGEGFGGSDVGVDIDGGEGDGEDEGWWWLRVRV